LVTGAAGFIGANLTRSLIERGADVHGAVRSSTDLWRLEEIRTKLRLHCAELSDTRAIDSIVKAVRPQVIFHLAATSGHPSSPLERAEALQSTVLGTRNLLRAVRELDFDRFVHLGSYTEYAPQSRPVNESDTLQPTIFRGVMKAAATVSVEQFARRHSLPVTILRPSSIYGCWEGGRRFIPTLIRAAVHQREVPLTQAGIRRDYLFVEDLIEACLGTVDADNVDGEVINIASGREWTNEEVVEAMQSVSDGPIAVRIGAYPTRDVDSVNQRLDVSKAKSFLGWTPRHDLKRGLEKMLAWYRDHESLYPKEMHQEAVGRG
jgi:nucleoside-diphosphate-sugar epimerase